MSIASIPTHADALALADRLERAARWRRVSLRWRVAIAVASLALLGAAFVAAWTFLRGPLTTAFAFLDAQAPLLALLAGAIAWSRVCDLRRAGARRQATSWLAAAPIGERERTAQLRRTVALRFAPPCTALFALASMLAIGAAADASRAFAACAIGLVFGTCGGWLRGAHALPESAPAPPRLRRRRVAANANADFAALHRWPFARWLADAQPRQQAHLFAAVLLTLPMGTSFLLGLRIALFVAVAIAAFGLLRALLASIAQAADVLRSAPLLSATLATQLVARPLFAQVAFAGTEVALVGKDADIGIVLGAAVAWACICLAATAFALRRRVFIAGKP